MKEDPTKQQSTESKPAPDNADILLLKDRALDVAVEGITIADMRLPDQPLIYINEGFERLTGYSAKSMVGKNCRFLQGPDTDPATVQEIRDALALGRECTVEILNHTKEGIPFWNRLSLSPVVDPEGEVTHFIGVQSDITKRIKAEEAVREANRRLEIANRRMKHDLLAAARIQNSLLPDEKLGYEGINFSTRVQQCDELGGDTLNVFPLEDNRYAVYTVDVSGHGVRASLLSTTLSHWFLRVLEGPADQAGRFPFTSVEVAEELNRQFQMNNEDVQYFTMCFGIVDLNEGNFRYVSAGSPPVIVARADGTTEVLSIEGFPVGIVEEPSYSENFLSLTHGDRVFVYTDGVIEAEDEKETSFGTNKLEEEILQNSGRSLSECVGSILDSVISWEKHRGLNDDCSILAFEILESANG